MIGGVEHAVEGAQPSMVRVPARNEADRMQAVRCGECIANCLGEAAAAQTDRHDTVGCVGSHAY